jgi:hypothetical protein
MTAILQVQILIIDKDRSELRSRQFEDFSAPWESTFLVKSKGSRSRNASEARNKSFVLLAATSPSRPTMSTTYLLLVGSIVKTLYTNILGVEVTPSAAKMFQLCAHTKLPMDSERIKLLAAEMVDEAQRMMNENENALLIAKDKFLSTLKNSQHISRVDCGWSGVE